VTRTETLFGVRSDPPFRTAGGPPQLQNSSLSTIIDIGNRRWQTTHSEECYQRLDTAAADIRALGQKDPRPDTCGQPSAGRVQKDRVRAAICGRVQKDHSAAARGPKGPQLAKPGLWLLQYTMLAIIGNKQGYRTLLKRSPAIAEIPVYSQFFPFSHSGWELGLVAFYQLNHQLSTDTTLVTTISKILIGSI